MYDPILYPTDGSDSASAALEHVSQLAKAYGATVHVLYVIDTKHAALGLGTDPNRGSTPGMVGDPGGGEAPMVGERASTEGVRQEAMEYGETVVEDAVRRMAPVETETVVRGGDLYQTILEYAETNGVDLIVMGTRGRSGLSRYLLGSITDRIVRTADMPVLTVRKEDLLKEPSELS